jgi:hypothetical protein
MLGPCSASRRWTATLPFRSHRSQANSIMPKRATSPSRIEPLISAPAEAYAPARSPPSASGRRRRRFLRFRDPWGSDAVQSVACRSRPPARRGLRRRRAASIIRWVSSRRGAPPANHSPWRKRAACWLARQPAKQMLEPAPSRGAKISSEPIRAGARITNAK